MSKVAVCVLVMFFAAGMVLPCGAYGQEETSDYLYGEVVEIAGDTITISEVLYDEDTGEETAVEAVYTVSGDAGMDNVDSLEAIQKGEKVDIEYYEQDGNKVITYIYVYSEGEEF